MADENKLRLLLSLREKEVNRKLKEAKRQLDSVAVGSIMDGYGRGLIEAYTNELTFIRLALKEVQKNGD